MQVSIDTKKTLNCSLLAPLRAANRTELPCNKRSWQMPPNLPQHACTGILDLSCMSDNKQTECTHPAQLQPGGRPAGRAGGLTPGRHQ